METEEGSIYAFSKDRKSISVNGKWFRNFVPLKDDIIKGIEYKITYTTKKDGDKEFHNIKSIVALEKPKIIQGYEKPKQIMTKEALGLNNELLPKSIPNQTENTILMCCKDILTTEICTGTKFTESEFKDKLNWLVTLFRDSYILL